MRALAVRSYALREMARLLRRRPGSFVLAVLLAAAAFSLPLAGVSVARALAPLAGALQLGPEVNLFLAPATPAAEIRQLQARLAARAGVTRVEWISRDAALKSLAQRSGSIGLGELKSNPLPDVLVLGFAVDLPPAALDAAVAEMRALPRVEAVAADIGWHRKLAALARTARTAGLMLGPLAVALLALIALGAVQLQLATSRDDIRVLRLAGADTRFIVRPYAYAGALTLACGVALAMVLVWLALDVLASDAAELAQLYKVRLTLVPLPPEWLAALGAGAAVLGGASASLGARWALRSVR